MRVAIIGYGVVGQAMADLFPDARIYDPAKGLYTLPDADIAFVCVPTPEAADGSCDASIVEDVIRKHAPALFVIRSTIPPGTTRALEARYGKQIVFQPEYLGMTPGHRYTGDRDVPFVILGGHRVNTDTVADLYRTVLPPETAYHHTDAETAELTKYATNTFLAAKVEFANELYDACVVMGLDYERVRELWLLDSRIGRSHTGVNRHDRGFGGACFPKDIAAFVAWAEGQGSSVPMVRAAMEANRKRRRKLRPPQIA